MQTRYEPGARIGGRYLVHDALMGGMGEVYLCLDLETIEPYALKTFQARYLSNPQIRDLFEREVATWVALEKHANIVRCHWMEVLDNQPFMFLEWIAGDESRGTDLRSWLRRGALDLRLALDFTIDICRGLIHANQKQPGIVHRDLKPGNILINQARQAKITDFGLAKIVQDAGLELSQSEHPTEDRQSLMGTDGVVGTPPYMPPEQWQALELDARADIYAIGCILYEMLTGKSPFTVRLTPRQWRKWLAAWQTEHEETPPSVLPATFPQKLREVVQTCLAKEPDERFATVEALLECLSQLYQTQFATSPKAISASDAFTAIDYINRGGTYDNLARFDMALAEYERAIQLDPSFAGVYNNRGNTYRKLGRFNLALADHGRALQLDPSLATAYYNRGLTYDNLGRDEDALAEYGRALQLDPFFRQAYLARGNTYRKRARYYEALADYGRAIQLDPFFKQAYNNRGSTYDDLGRYDEALADFGRAIQLDPSFAGAYNNRGLTYESLKRFDLALIDFEQAIQFDPSFAGAYYNRGNIYVHMGNIESALADFERTTQLDPEYAAAYFNIGASLHNRGQSHQALPYFEKAAQLAYPRAAPIVARLRQQLGLEHTSPENPAQQGFDIFQRAQSINQMRQAIAHYPFMVAAEFITMVEQITTQQVPPEYQPYFSERLTWLRKIADEQK